MWIYVMFSVYARKVILPKHSSISQVWFSPLSDIRHSILSYCKLFSVMICYKQSSIYL